MIQVLCINDSSINLFVQKKLLLQSGITDNVITASDGQEALDYYSRFKDAPAFEYPRLIVLDIHMPRVDGWEFLDKFSELYLPSFNETRVVINSFTVDANEIRKAKDYPMVIDFVTSQLTTEYFRKLKLSGQANKMPQGDPEDILIKS